MALINLAAQGHLRRKHPAGLLPGHVLVPGGLQAGEDGRRAGLRGHLRARHHRADQLGWCTSTCSPTAQPGRGSVPQMADVDLSFLNFVAFIAVIAVMVQLVEMVIEKTSTGLYHGARHLPAADRRQLLHPGRIAVPGGAQLHVPASRPCSGCRSGIGWMLAIVALAVDPGEDPLLQRTGGPARAGHDHAVDRADVDRAS